MAQAEATDGCPLSTSTPSIMTPMSTGSQRGPWFLRRTNSSVVVSASSISASSFWTTWRTDNQGGRKISQELDKTETHLFFQIEANQAVHCIYSKSVLCPHSNTVICRHLTSRCRVELYMTVSHWREATQVCSVWKTLLMSIALNTWISQLTDQRIHTDETPHGCDQCVKFNF